MSNGSTNERGYDIAGDGFLIEEVAEKVWDLRDLAIKAECCFSFDITGTVKWGKLPGYLSWDDKNITNSDKEMKTLMETLGEYKRIET